MQAPAHRATKRDESRIAAWEDEQWPVIKGRRQTWVPGSASKTRQVRASGRRRAGVARPPVVRGPAAGAERVSLAALTCTRTGRRPRCQLPLYAPELDPVEAEWSHLKRSLANLAERNIDQLRGQPQVVTVTSNRAVTAARRCRTAPPAPVAPGLPWPFALWRGGAGSGVGPARRGGAALPGAAGRGRPGSAMTYAAGP
ncbi:hypothetical protein [Streptomyces sp. NBC_00827]|uniref:hypothetical protein n=1 Tax=Streptomyces sp. NBC_00827 TaxID=2903677 RepID=UPI0038631212